MEFLWRWFEIKTDEMYALNWNELTLFHLDLGGDECACEFAAFSEFGSGWVDVDVDMFNEWQC